MCMFHLGAKKGFVASKTWPVMGQTQGNSHATSVFIGEYLQLDYRHYQMHGTVFGIRKQMQANALQ